jgi:hypothetical protein
MGSTTSIEANLQTEIFLKKKLKILPKKSLPMTSTVFCRLASIEVI